MKRHRFVLAAFAHVFFASAPAYADDAPVGWGPTERQGSRWEVGLGSITAAYVSRTGVAAGASAHLGLRWFRAMNSFGFDEGFREVTWGDYWGGDLRIHAGSDFAARSPGESWIAFGFAPVLHNMLGESTTTSRVTGPSIVGVLAPEVGWIARPSSMGSMYTAHSLPMAFLLNDDFALEAAPALWILYRTERGAPDVMFSFSLSLLYRGPRPAESPLFYW